MRFATILNEALRINTYYADDETGKCQNSGWYFSDFPRKWDQTFYVKEAIQVLFSSNNDAHYTHFLKCLLLMF